ncbi:MAG: GerMN domain-containing protein [Candidatus Gastranaerophilales bacterium]|nr:GerMN domain-containing protein [Candidatus Gastranaerophilales bacterium]
MIRGIFIFLITCLILAGAGFFLKDKLGFDAIENFNVDKITGSLTQDKFSQDKDINSDDNKTDIDNLGQDDDNEAEVYFLKENGENVKFSTTRKNVKSESDKFRASMEALFSGPSGLEKIAGVYSEIPPETKLLGIKEDATSYTINISDDFEMGGGADSMKIRVKQLVTTATQAAGEKDVYLEINGKRAEYVGGEGIMILQPLKRNL